MSWTSIWLNSLIENFSNERKSKNNEKSRRILWDAAAFVFVKMARRGSGHCPAGSQKIQYTFCAKCAILSSACAGMG